MSIFMDSPDFKGRAIVAVGLVTSAIVLGAIFTGKFVVAAYLTVFAGMMLEFYKHSREINVAQHKDNLNFFKVWAVYIVLFVVMVVVFLWNYDLLMADHNLLKIAIITSLTTCAADIGAYVGGRWLGKTKITDNLAPVLSPNKTQIGAVFGIISATFIFSIATHLLYGDILQLSSDTLTFIGGSFGVICVYSDLLSSIAKRSIGIDDFSYWLGAHGGFGDRFDAQKVLLVCGVIVFIVLL